MRTVLMSILLVLVLVVCIGGCTEEQEQAVGKGAKKTGDLARGAAPILPPPFNAIAIFVGATATAVEAWSLRRAAKRAKTAELQVVAESAAKNKVNRAMLEFTDFLDRARSDPKLKTHVDAVLKRLELVKAQEPWVRKTLGVMDALRKGLITIEQLTEQLRPKELLEPGVPAVAPGH